jgi:hypothetical protein
MKEDMLIGLLVAAAVAAATVAAAVAAATVAAAVAAATVAAARILIVIDILPAVRENYRFPSGRRKRYNGP